MSIQTIYKCDKCGTEQATSTQFWTVGVVATYHGFHMGNKDYADGKSMQVCRPCLESFGIHVMQKQEENEVKPPTLEELIREIIQRCSE